jgi:predicted DNA-binding transcriptional regulator YafY
MASRVGVHVRESDPGPYLDALAEAVVDGQALVLTYSGPEGEAEREVDPYLLYSQGGVWYLQGFCQMRQAIRIFRTDRIRTMQFSRRRFTPPPDQDGAGIVVEEPAELREMLRESALKIAEANAERR